MLRSKLGLILSLLAAFPGPAWAGPPFVTDDPEPVDNRHWEINYALSLTKVHAGTAAAVPSIDINYGLMEDVQIHAQPSLAYDKTDGNAHYGLDNLEIGVKYRFLNHQDQHAHWMLSVYPSLQLPTADKALDPDQGKIQVYLPLWFQRDSEDWTIFGGAGYHINQGVDARNSYFTGIAAMNHVSERLQLGGELFRETAAITGEKTAGGFNLGGKYDWSDRYHVLFSAGRGLINAASTNQFSAYVGLQTTF